MERSFDKISYLINTGPQQTANITDLYFSGGNIVKNNDGSQVITFELPDSAGQTVSHQFIIKPGNYMLDWNISLTGADRLITQNSLNMLWQTEARQHELDILSEKERHRSAFMKAGALIILL
ncbi:MAG: hypothetical protein HC867_04030 [Bacteroidia bacterium]|nr:hypothetical protein [Bacteroidia bacterium]